MLTVSASAQAQIESSLSGTVRYSATRQPLHRAAVVIDYEKATIGTYTNEDGTYSVKVQPGRRIVVVRHVGYVPFRTYLRVSSNTRPDVRLPSVASQLEEVIITSKGYDRNVRQPLLGVSQINIATLERMPAALGETDILRSPQLLPGVVSVGEAANGVNIRGGTLTPPLNVQTTIRKWVDKQTAEPFALGDYDEQGNIVPGDQQLFYALYRRKPGSEPEVRSQPLGYAIIGGGPRPPTTVCGPSTSAPPAGRATEPLNALVSFFINQVRTVALCMKKTASTHERRR